ncbi:MAG: YfiR family protein [Terriglobia bacterium]
MLRFALLAGAAVLAGIPGHPLSATGRSEYEVKAAYLYNFGRFVEWPPDVPSSQADEFTICVLGRDPFGLALDTTISGEKIEGKNVVARRISKAEEVENCRILFISASEDRQLKAILATAGRLGVLTVSDLPGFVKKGGMVEFVLANERVRFAINLGADQQARLNLSSDLLKVAAEVRGSSRPTE